MTNTEKLDQAAGLIGDVFMGELNEPDVEELNQAICLVQRVRLRLQVKSEQGVTNGR